MEIPLSFRLQEPQLDQAAEVFFNLKLPASEIFPVRGIAN
jgi:hypothetical protein